MSDLDLERLGELWRGDPDPEEAAALQRTAQEVSRRARRAALIENVLAGLTGLVILLLVSLNPVPRVLAIGAAALLILITSQIRQRRFRRVEVQSLAGDTPTMLDQSIERVETTLRRTRFGMLVIGPATAVGAFLAFNVDRTQEAGRLLPFSQGLMQVLIVLLSLFVLAAMLIHLRVTQKQNEGELRRLRDLRESYRKEQSATEQK